jgi:4-amino-4-deoxy-L-arabinose transferase-like glycosyltransferase
VGQLESGHGYTLQESPLVTRGIVDRYQYDRPLFYHPPGGIALFWLGYELLGKSGFPAVQVGAFALFFWSMLLLAHRLRVTQTDPGLFLVALLSACNPILAHVTTKFWLDAPLLAFATLGVALFVHAFDRKVSSLSAGGAEGRGRMPGKRGHALHRASGAKRGSPSPRLSTGLRWELLAVAAGVVIGYASLIKLTAFLVVPGALLLCLARERPARWKSLLRLGLCLVIPAVVVQAPWELWQWRVVGSAFPQWAGKPSETLVRSNAYVQFLTVVRSPWVYLTTTPLVVTTLVPATALLALSLARKTQDPGSPASSTPHAVALAVACLSWILLVIAFHTALGFVGYSKLLRYIILITPASVLLPSLLIPHGLAQRSRQRRWLGRLELALLVLAAASVVAEVGIGIGAAFYVERALIIPPTGL